MPRGGAAYNIHEMDFSPAAIAADTGVLLLQTKIPVDTAAGTVVLKDWTCFGTGIHMNFYTSGNSFAPVLTLWRVPENFTLAQLTAVPFYTACTRFQDMLWCIFQPKIRTVAATLGADTLYELSEQISSKRTFGPKDNLVLIAYNPHGGVTLTFVSKGFLDYFYA